MNRLVVFLGAIAVLSLAGCQPMRPPVNRVQSNLVEKSIFQGEWWYARTVVDLNYEDTQSSLGSGGIFTTAAFVGDMSADMGIAGYNLARIRWVIDENTLFAYRSYELVSGGNDDYPNNPDYRGQPVAAFAISGHVDVRRDYNGLTGERTNVLVENTADRRWYERQYMRVDWSKNLIAGSYYGNSSSDFNELFGAFTREPAPFFCQEGSNCPASYMPQFIRLRDDSTYRFHGEWPQGSDDTIHYMSFVTQELWSPGLGPLLIGGSGIPTSSQITIRNSFLRVPPRHDYDAELEQHSEFDRFGVIRMSQRTYSRGGRDAPGGGLTPDFGETDFLNFYRSRHDFWDHNLRPDRACRNNSGCMDMPGSICDQSQSRCTNPLGMRTPKQVTYTLNPHFPPYLVRTAYEVMGEWNGVVMGGFRSALGREENPVYAEQQCQDTDPFAYCYCRALPGGQTTCAGKYDPFTPPSAATVTSGRAFDCYVQGPPDPGHPSSFADYPAPQAYQYSFVGAECRLLLESNRCDLTPGAACQDLGDIRYNFFNFIDHRGVSFGGVSLPLSDPLTGELIVANLNMSGESVDGYGAVADIFDVLTGDLSEQQWFGSEHVRNYFQNTGYVDRVYPPAAVVGAGGPGGPDETRGAPAEIQGLDIDRAIARMEGARPRIERLRGIEGRAQIHSDRLNGLAGTSIEDRFLSGMGRENLQLYAQSQGLDLDRLTASDVSATDSRIADAVSPFRGNYLDTITRQQRQMLWMAEHHMDPPLTGQIYNRVDALFWANVTHDIPNPELAMRLRQSVLRFVMLHEMGHSLGLEHNMAGSLDRNNYFDDYYALNGDMPLPAYNDYDANSDGAVVGEELTRWQHDYRETSDRRALAGMSIYQGAAIMDYGLGFGFDYSGLGRWDKAAVIFNYTDQVEAYVGDPRERQPSGEILHRPDRTPRQLWHFYRGGETCTADSECPFAAGSTSIPGTQLVTQHCVNHPRYDRTTAACHSDPRYPDVPCICSQFDTDFTNFIQVGGCRTDDNRCVPAAEAGGCDPSRTCGWATAGSIGDAPVYPVRYLYCDNSRINDISWCNWFDQGESFREDLNNWRRAFYQSYPGYYYRHYQAGFQGSSEFIYYQLAAKFFQHLFFRYYNEPEFRSEEGPLGFLDQYYASVDSMDWFAEMIALPEDGPYNFDADHNIYVPASGDRGDITLGLGQGFPLWSTWQTGLNGWYRMASNGQMYNKLNAIYALAIRDWGLSFGTDERYYINYYDLFDVEMSDLFGGLIVDDPREFSPRVSTDGGQVRIQYMDYFRDTCQSGGRNLPCRQTSLSEAYPAPAVRSGSSEVIRDFAAVMSLAQFPVFFDTSYEQKLYIFVEGNGDGFRLPEVRADGTPTCEYGATACTDPDYIRYTSDHFAQTYVAVAIHPRLEYNLPEENIGFRLLVKARELQDHVRTLAALPRPTAEQTAELADTRRRLDQHETFMEYLIQLQHQYGVSSYF